MTALTIEKIKSRIENLDTDIKRLQDLVSDFETKKIETVAQLNAYQGAKKQCEMFLKDLENETADSGLDLPEPETTGQ
jgi:archaellum component FlaC